MPKTIEEAERRAWFYSCTRYLGWGCGIEFETRELFKDIHRKACADKLSSFMRKNWGIYGLGLIELMGFYEGRASSIKKGS